MQVSPYYRKVGLGPWSFILTLAWIVIMDITIRYCRWTWISSRTLPDVYLGAYVQQHPWQLYRFGSLSVLPAKVGRGTALLTTKKKKGRAWAPCCALYFVFTDHVLTHANTGHYGYFASSSSLLFLLFFFGCAIACTSTGLRAYGTGGPSVIGPSSRHCNSFLKTRKLI